MGDAGVLAWPESQSGPQVTKRVDQTVVVPGASSVVAHISSWGNGVWAYSLYDADGVLVGTDVLSLPGWNVAAWQVARIAFVLETDIEDGD